MGSRCGEDEEGQRAEGRAGRRDIRPETRRPESRRDLRRARRSEEGGGRVGALRRVTAWNDLSLKKYMNPRIKEMRMIAFLKRDPDTDV